MNDTFCSFVKYQITLFLKHDGTMVRKYKLIRPLSLVLDATRKRTIDGWSKQTSARTQQDKVSLRIETKH